MFGRFHGDVKADEVVRDRKTENGEMCDHVTVSEEMMSGIRQQSSGMLMARAKGKARLATFKVPSLHVRSFQPSLKTTWRPMEARRNATLSLMPRRPRNHSRIVVSHEAHSYFTRLGLRPHFSRREHQ